LNDEERKKGLSAGAKRKKRKITKKEGLGINGLCVRAGVDNSSRGSYKLCSSRGFSSYEGRCKRKEEKLEGSTSKNGTKSINHRKGQFAKIRRD